MNALEKLLRTDDSNTSFALRVTLGLLMFPHGAQKLLGWFGGYGFSGTMGYFTGTLGLPSAIAFLVIMAESLGALALVLGAGTRVAAAGILAVMLGAVQMAHLQHGFFMNWFGNQAGEGFEYHLLVMAIAATLTAVGAGRRSVDGWAASRIGAPAGEAHPTLRPARDAA